MHKEDLLDKIITTLTSDLSILTEAAKTAHAAATHAECLPDNKYDTTGLEASYVAQGQANRAQDIRKSLDTYRTLSLRHFDDVTPIPARLPSVLAGVMAVLMTYLLARKLYDDKVAFWAAVIMATSQRF